MNGQQTTGEPGTTAGTVGAVPPTATGATSATTPSAQTAGTAGAAVQNQQSNNNAVTPSQAASATGQMVPLSVVTELRQKNRTMEAQIQGVLRQNQELMAQLQAGLRTQVADDQVAPEDERILSALEKRVAKMFGPAIQQQQQFIEQQRRRERMEVGRQREAELVQKHPIFAEQSLIGRAARLELQSKLAEAQAMADQFGYQVNYLEIAEEVAMRVAAERQAYDGQIAQTLVQGARATQPSATAAAAVTSGGASAPMGSSLPPAASYREAVQRALDNRAAARVGAA